MRKEKTNVVSMLQYRQRQLGVLRQQRDAETDLYGLEALVTKIAAIVAVIEWHQANSGEVAEKAEADWLFKQQAKFLFS